MESEHSKIPAHIQKLQQFEDFYKFNLDLRVDYGTNERAYDAAERIYLSYFGVKRYKSFESYRQAEIRFLKKQRK
ncbi:MAG: hypothetical protein Q8N05_05730 [Bacteroidota bacterium]|nr:hypothetical protein [Bacteroidota bacterium]